jgi:hypothetical protein
VSRVATLIAAVGIGLFLVAWWVGGERSEAVARDYFATHAWALQARDTEVTNVDRGFPPFWSVSINGYASAMVLWVEPLTGFVFVFAQG